MYLVVICVLSLVLAFNAPPFRLVRDPEWVIACVVLAALLPGAVAVWASRRCLRALDQHPGDPGLGQFKFGRGMLMVQAALVLVHGTLLACTDWLIVCGKVPVIGTWPVVPGLLAATPFLLSIVLAWIAVYPADRALREIALESFLLRSKPVRPPWPLRRFLVYSLRHQVLFILVPMVLILAARDLISLYDEPIRKFFKNGFAPDLLLGLSACTVAVVAPAILRHVWVTKPLPAGPLRDRLLYLCRTLRMRCREILVWQSGGMIVNAAVMGVVAPLRYVMITDAMLEQMGDTQIEAVFGHESGHVKRHHILFFLLYAFISGCIVTLFGQYSRQMDEVTRQVATVGLGGVLVFKWGYLFGWISRSFERQADLYGVRTLARGGLPCTADCALHSAPAGNPGEGARPKRDPLCFTAAHIFGDTLHEVAFLNGIPPKARSWRHGSIESRSRTVMRLAGDPVATACFERLVARIKLGILIVTLVVGAWAGTELKVWAMLGIGAG